MKQPQYNTALYMRLSRDDETFGDSVSIETQRTVLTQFVREHPEFHVVSEFVDDGWSETNFDRPGLNEAVELMEAGQVRSLIVKDHSRLGRNSLIVGQLLEEDFVRLNVRYIAIMDNIDTAKELSDIVPVQDLFNEWYAKRCGFSKNYFLCSMFAGICNR